ncbi:MAG: TonB-dependent receptor, partial [Dokdonella sp.]
AIPAAPQANPLHSGGVIDLDGDFRGADVRWSWQPAALELSVGLSADEQDQRRRGFENFIGDQLGVRGALRRDERNRVNNLDGYAQLMWPLGSSWNLSAGLRHSRVRFRVDDDYQHAGNPDDSGQRAYSALTPVAGALYRATPRLHLYASVGEGFETPTFAELGYRPDGGSGLNFSLAPARSRNAELGAKWRWADAGHAELALFRADSRDELAVASNAGGRSSYRNVGQARRQGAELSLDWTFASVWQLELAATWLQARFRSPLLACSGTPCTSPNTPVAAGARIPGVPEAWWHMELARGGDLGWRASLRADGVAAVTVNDIGSARAPGYQLLGLQLAHGWALRQGHLRAFARLDNLFDRAYVGSVIVNDGNARYYEPGPGRGVLLGLRWSGSTR